MRSQEKSQRYSTVVVVIDSSDKKKCVSISAKSVTGGAHDDCAILTLTLLLTPFRSKYTKPSIRSFQSPFHGAIAVGGDLQLQ